MSAGKSGLELQGFDEFYTKLQEINRNADKIAKRQFEKCMDILEDELRTTSAKSGLSSRLVNQIERNTEKGQANFYGQVGWTPKQGSGKEASDFEKVIFYNYGTPTRKTNRDNQHVQINGKWVTLGKNRGAVESHNFVRKAKQSAKRKTKALMKKTLQAILNR